MARKKKEGRLGIFEIQKPEVSERGALESNGDFIWQYKRGGRVMARSEQTYVRARGAQRAIDNMVDAIRSEKIRVDILDK